jgi:lysophospholipase L1-like esterase
VSPLLAAPFKTTVSQTTVFKTAAPMVGALMVGALMVGGLMVGGVAAAAPAVVAAGGAGSGETVSPSFYVALGDSVPVWDGSHSYPHLLRKHYRASVPGLALEDMAVSGATTTSMLEGGQYRSALRFLRRHVGQIALITIDIGGNDIVGCASPTGIDRSCVAKGLATVDKNLSTMLSGLRAAAPSVPLIGMTYYDPFLGDWLAGGAARTLALDSLSVVDTLNRELDSLYGASSTAGVARAFTTDDDSTFVDSPWGSVPVDVDRACSWLDITCQAGQTEGFGDDPNVPGQREIADAFEITIGDLRTP